MQPYKSFGSFVAWYVGPSDDIALLRQRFCKRLHRHGVGLYPYRYRKPADVEALVRDVYKDQEELKRAIRKAAAAFNSAAHTEQVEQARGSGASQRFKRAA